MRNTLRVNLICMRRELMGPEGRLEEMCVRRRGRCWGGRQGVQGHLGPTAGRHALGHGERIRWEVGHYVTLGYAAVRCREGPSGSPALAQP